MSAGFEVLRPDGTSAVSSFYSHYRFVKKMRGLGNFWDTSGQQYSDNVLVAFRTDSKRISVNRFSKGARNLWSANPAPPSNATLSFYTAEMSDVYIFDTTPNTSSTRAGLVVYDQQGNITFDTGHRYLRVLDVITSAVSNAPIRYVGSKLACIPLVQAQYSEGYRNGGEQYYGATWEYASGDEFKVDYVESVYDWYGQDYKAASTNYMCIIVDVAHIDAA